jgi:hypothetical protein
MIWRIRLSSARLRADLDACGHDLFQRAGEFVRAFAERGEGKAYPVDIDASVWRLFVEGGQVLVRVALDVDELEVLRVIPDEPLPPAEPLLDEAAPPSSER